MYGMSFQVKHIGILFCLLMAQPLQLLVKILLDLFGVEVLITETMMLYTYIYCLIEMYILLLIAQIKE